MARDDICTNCGSSYDRCESKADHSEEFCKKTCEQEFDELSEIDFELGDEISE